MNEKLISVNVLNTLTVCRKAGKLVTGFDASKDAILSNRAHLVLLARDISPKTEKEIRFFADKAGVKVLNTPLTIDELSAGVGKKAGIFTICDAGLSDKLSEILVFYY